MSSVNLGTFFVQYSGDNYDEDTRWQQHKQQKRNTIRGSFVAEALAQ